MLLGAGLPILPGLAGEAKSYAERLFSFPDVGALSEEDAARALRDLFGRDGARAGLDGGDQRRAGRTIED